MRHHYLPQFLLRGFADEEGLWQFDINTGSFERRSVENAGQRRHFYTVELEQGLLQRVDGEAGAIFAKGTLGADGHILLNSDDRPKLARWIALFAIRTPATFENFKGYFEEASQNSQAAIDVMYGGRERVLQLARESGPDAYREMITEFGRLAGEELILAAFANSIRQGRVKYLPDPKESFVDYISEARMNNFAARLLSFEWVWLRSRYGFIIGDNPLCRWSTTKRTWNYGLNHRDIEITIPLSRSVCLRLQRSECRAQHSLYCNREMTRLYNERQMISSVYNVYGPQLRLRPMAARLVAVAIERGKLAEPPRHAP